MSENVTETPFCASDRSIAEYSNGIIADEAIEVHIETCEACQVRVEKTQNQLLADLQKPNSTLKQLLVEIANSRIKELRAIPDYDDCKLLFLGGQCLVATAKTKQGRRKCLKVLDYDYSRVRAGGRLVWEQTVSRLALETQVGLLIDSPYCCSSTSLQTLSADHLTQVDAENLVLRAGLVPERTFVAEFDMIPGINLGKRLSTDGTKLTLEETRQLLREMANALIAYQEMLVHRDISPNNIMVSDGPETARRFVLVDFGLAKLLKQSEETQIWRGTVAGTHFGTPGFVAPEQLADAKQSSIKADVFALGRVALWCHSDSTSRNRANWDKGAWHTVFDCLPQDYRNLIARMTDENPQMRPTPQALLRGAEQLNPIDPTKYAVHEPACSTRHFPTQTSMMLSGLAILTAITFAVVYSQI